MTTETRLEADSIGTMEVPAEAYYGVQALRAKQNFPITGTKLHPVFIRNLAQIKKAAAAGCIFLTLAMTCVGCAGIEPEKRMYPLAFGIDVSGDDFVISYGMPDLPEATGQGKEEEDGNQTLQVRGKSFEEIKSRYERSQEKYLDIGHLQILILSQDLTATDMWKDFFEYLREEPLAGENIYVFQTQEPEKLLGWKEGGTSVGEYITGLMENRMDREQKNGVTLRQVYYQWYQNGTLKKLPKITLSEDQIQVWLE